MLNENIEVTRKSKGLTQEELAIRLNVTRQTVSKWEKGYSVPDADVLSKMAEVLETSVSALLGEGMQDTQETNQIAEQLARVNEQLAISNRRWRKVGKVFKIIAIMVVAVWVGMFILIGLSMIAYEENDNVIAGKAELICTFEDEQYIYGVEYDENYQILVAGGDSYIANHVMVERCSDANVLVAQIEDYFEAKGGTVNVTNQEGLKLVEY